MYLIQWFEDGENKTVVADSWICKESIMSELEEKDLFPVYKVI